jgi:DNA-directed RNA polymerase II subunit RPB1
MEDCKIYYDQTVRNAGGAIIQFIYGEDGMEGTKVEKQFIPTIDLDMIELDTKYHLRPEDALQIHMHPEAFKRMSGDTTWMKRCDEQFQQIVEDREYLIKEIFNGEKTNMIIYPIPFDRILKNARARISDAGLDGVPSDLTPTEILDEIDRLSNKLYINVPKQGTRFLEILLRIHLSPKPMIMRYHMTRDTFKWIVDEIERRYYEAIAHAGEMVGIIAAQSIGEPATQLTLDSFHSSGTAAAVKATSGVPRLKELLSVTKNIKTPTLRIHFKEDIGTVFNPSENKDKKNSDENDPVAAAKGRVLTLMHKFEMTSISNILEMSEIFWDPPGNNGLYTGIADDNGLLELYRIFQRVNPQECYSRSPWILRMRLNKEKMHAHGLTMLDVYTNIEKSHGDAIECIFSDDNADELIFRIRIMDTKAKEVDIEDTVAALKAVEFNIINNVILKGTDGIRKASIRMIESKRYNAESMGFDNVAEWIMDTDGTNLEALLANPNIDKTRTISNDVCEIYKTLGIEAARIALYNEIMEVIRESSINYRHIALLIDTVTNRGSLMSVDRHGINRADVGPLAKSSFEETTNMLIDASVFSEYDRINGVSANIMLGQLPPCGTGDCEIMLDEIRFAELLKELPERPVAKKIEVEPEVVITEPCRPQDIAFNFEMPTSSRPVAKLPVPNIIFT